MPLIQPPATSGISGIVVQEADGNPSGTATVVVVPNTTLAVSGGTATYTPTGSAGVIVQEVDGDPIGTATVIVVNNGALTFSNGTATVDVSGTATAEIIVQDEGVTIGTATVLNITGAGGTATFSNGTATVDVASGAGGAGTANKYVTTAAAADLSAEIVIPGLAGSPDKIGGGGDDDEFDVTDAADPITGWTTLGSPTALDRNTTALSHLYISQAAGASAAIAGVYKASPSIPFTMTAKISDHNIRPGATGQAVGIAVAASTPAGLQILTINDTSGVSWQKWDSITAWNSNTALATPGHLPMYLRIVVTSSTDIAAYYSFNGLVWTTLATGTNPSITVGSTCLFTQRSGSTIPVAALFDWVRFS